jgi:hypothetical protein
MLSRTALACLIGVAFGAILCVPLAGAQTTVVCELPLRTQLRKVAGRQAALKMLRALFPA